MATFKVKHDKTKNLIQINTLDENHKKIMNSFHNKRVYLPKKKKRLDIVKKQLDKLEKVNASLYTNDDIKKRSELKSEIQNLEDEINDIENDLSELDYYSKTEDIIMDYYQMIDHDDDVFYMENPELSEAQDTNKIIDSETEHLDKLNMINKNKRKIKKITKRRKRRIVQTNQISILDFLSGNYQNTIEETESDIIEIEPNSPKNKSELLDQYMMLIDSNYACEKKQNEGKIKKCPLCNIEKTLMHSEGMYVCQTCGEVDFVIIDSEKPNYKEAVSDTKPGYPYKRINHLNEWLAQFQAKESIEIPEDIYNRILAELHKNRIYDLKKLSLTYMKKILKILGLTSYYEHTTYIISKLSGIQPPTINRETEEKIRLMFRQIQVPFEKYCPRNRTNFLSYSYVLHKFFQLLELDDFVEFFPLLKSREKLKQQDIIWEKICVELNWDYIPSV